ncbi:MAG: hypothetical protein ABIQ16_19480 [Polyangiaceae bacterium]
MRPTRLRAIATFLQVAPIAPPMTAEAPTVHMVTPCPIAGTSIEGVVAILRAQLAPLVVDPSTSRGANSMANVQLFVDGCRAKGADLEVIVEYRGEQHLLAIDLGDVAPIARNRTLALALAESIQHALSPLANDQISASQSATVSAEPSEQPGNRPLTVAPKASALKLPRVKEPEMDRGLESAAQGVGVVAVQKPVTFTLLADPLLRYTVKTSTLYAGLDAGAGVGRFDFRLRALASQRSVQDASIWQGAALGVFSVNWLKLEPHASIRSELEVGAALAAPRSGDSSVARNAHSSHCGGATYLRLEAPLSGHFLLVSEVGAGFASSLTSQAYRVDSMSLSGLFFQASLGFAWAGGAARWR